MANAFNIDKGGSTTSDTHLINETFHVFSKSPGSPTTSLGGARLKSGHTTTASDVWADEIPAFFKAATQAKFDLFSTKAVKDDLCLFNGNVYQHNGTEFVSLGTEAEVLVDGATFKKNNKDVVKFHKGRTAINLTADNNNGDGSNNYTAKIYDAATGSTTFVPQFISAMDKMVDGIPSLAYDAAVFAGGSQLAEGLTADNDYICNAYAGVIQFNKARSSGVTVNAWEYIGTKLNSELARISAAVFGSNTPGEGEEDLSLSEQVTANTTAINVLKGSDEVDGSIAKSIKTAIENLGDVAVKSDITITDIKVKVGSGTATSLTPVDKSVTIEIPDAPEAVVTAEGTVTTDGFTKTDAVTSLAKAAINAAITGEDGAIAGAIDSAISDATLADGEKIATTTDTSKLVTVEDVTTYVSENAKVTLTQGTGITVTPNGKASTSFTVAVDDTVATKKSVDDLSDLVSKLPATIEAAQDAADAAMEEAQKKVASVTGPTTGLVTVTGDKEVTITVSDTIATKEYASTAASTSVNGLKETAITSQSVSGAGVSVTLGGKVGVPTLTGSVTPATYTSSTKSWTNDSNFAKASDIATAISDAVGAITIPSVTTSTAAQTVGVTASAHEVSVATATYTPASDDTDASWTNSGYLVTGATVEAFVGAETTKTLDAAKAFSQSLHTTSVTYHVTDTLPTVPSGKEEEYKGRIYLVLTGKDGVVAADGARIEYMYVNEGTEEAPSWDWEQIGTTTADLSGYAKSVTINGQTYTATAANAGALDLGKVVNAISTANDTSKGTSLDNTWSIQASITGTGSLYLGVASATDSVMGVSKMFTGTLSQSSNGASDTAVSVYSAQNMYSTLAALANDKVASVTAGNGDALTGLSVSVGGTATAPTISVTNGVINSGSIPVTAKVVANGLIDGTDVIETEKINFGPTNSNEQEAFIPYDSQLTTWIGDMPNLKGGGYMFDSCTALTSFCGDLSSLKNGGYMFSGCTALTSFCSDLSSLTNGGMMFWGCKLDAESLECIAETLPTVASGVMTISYNCSAAEAAVAQAAYDTITGKGWTCIMTYNA